MSAVLHCIHVSLSVFFLELICHQIEMRGDFVLEVPRVFIHL